MISIILNNSNNIYLYGVKKMIGILLTTLFLLASFQQAIILLHFKANQQYIEKTFCVNKSKPEKHCHGKCKLTKDLEQTSDLTPHSYSLYTSIDFVPVEVFLLDFQTAFSEEKSDETPFKERPYAHSFTQENLRPPANIS